VSFISFFLKLVSWLKIQLQQHPLHLKPIPYLGCNVPIGWFPFAGWHFCPWMGLQIQTVRMSKLGLRAKAGSSRGNCCFQDIVITENLQ
jgi:hypothetical protein